MNPKLKICNKSPHENPSYAKPGDSGMDLRAWITKDEHTLNSYDGTFIALQLKPFERRLIHTGIYVEIPYGYEIQVRPKSGQALKKGLIVLNTPGTVDVNYRGEICVIAINLSFDTIIIEDGEKIAQMVVCPVKHEGLIDTEYVDEISTDTERGAGGFGHTGTK